MTFDIIDAQDYCRSVSEYIAAATRRIAMTAMIIRTGNASHMLFEALQAAIGRGVEVHIVVDVFAGHMASRPQNLSKQQFRSQCLATRTILRDIQAAGGTVTWVGHIGFNPYAGRYHAKMIVVDDTVYSFGGLNVSDDSFEQTDYMLHVRSPALADRLYELARHNGNGQPAHDTDNRLDSHNRLLFDAGEPGHSVIYARACRLALHARTIVYVSQMCPSGPLAAAIAAADYTCYFNRPWQSGVRPNLAAQLWDNWRSGIRNSYKGRRYLHAKYMLFEQHDGAKILLSGSHNFSWRGVAFGSKEIALESTDQTVWDALYEYARGVAAAVRPRYTNNHDHYE